MIESASSDGVRRSVLVYLSNRVWLSEQWMDEGYRFTQ